MDAKVYDRRTACRLFKDVSLSRWLRAVAERHGVSAIVIADSTGLLIAGGIEDDEGERMAAIAAQHARPNEEVTAADEKGLAMTIRRFDWGQETLFASVRGEGAERCRAALGEAQAGALRILNDEVHKA